MATLAAAGVSIPVITLFGVPLGLRADLLVVGFFGSLVAMVLLDSVPSSGESLAHLLRTTLRRMLVAAASAATAGYVTPLALVVANVPDALLLPGAFAVGVGAKSVLSAAVMRLAPGRGA